MGEKGTAGYLIFGKGQVSSDERQQGFLDGMKKHPGIKVDLLEALAMSARLTATCKTC